MGSTDNQTLNEFHDTIIIGAGISGCAAAWYLKKRGRSSLILEAGDRVGGKTYTVPEGCTKSGVVDLGASWVNDSSQSYVNALIEEFGLERVVQNTDGLYITQSQDGSFISHGLHEKMSKRGGDFEVFLSKLKEVVETVNADDVANTPNAKELDVSVFDWLTKTFPDRPKLPQQVDSLLRTMLGADSKEASFLYYAHYFACGLGIQSMLGEERDEAQYQRLVDGTQSISNSIVARLPPGSVLLNHAVKAISQNNNVVKVTTANGQTFVAKRIIITIPPPLWNNIHWSPLLSERKAMISDSLTMPTYSKIVFAFRSGWWRPKFSGGVVFTSGPLALVRDTSIPSKDCWTLTGFATGKNGAAWGCQSKEKRRASAWEALKSGFAQFTDDIPEPVSVREMLWERYEYFGGAPSSYWPPGMLSEGFQKDLKAPFGNVHFAGSETASYFKGFIEGGARAAWRAVGEIHPE